MNPKVLKKPTKHSISRITTDNRAKEASIALELISCLKPKYRFNFVGQKFSLMGSERKFNKQSKTMEKSKNDEKIIWIKNYLFDLEFSLFFANFLF